MPLHLVKLSVGAESIADLRIWVASRVKQRKAKGLSAHHVHVTRMVPKRDAELLDGGSIFWVIKGQIAVRQKLFAIEPFRDADGIGRCRLLMKPTLIPIAPRLLRPFQGWRYLTDKDAPQDLGKVAKGAQAMPEEMRRDLRELGLL